MSSEVPVTARAAADARGARRATASRLGRRHQHGRRQGQVHGGLRRDGPGWARGWRVGVVQFMKSGDWKVGEQKLADHLGVDWWTLGDGFTWESTDLDESAAKNIHAWGVAQDKLASGDYDLLVLDELTYVVNYGWVSAGEVVDGILGRAPKTNVVITGRDARRSWSRSPTR